MVRARDKGYGDPSNVVVSCRDINSRNFNIFVVLRERTAINSPIQDLQQIFSRLLIQLDKALVEGGLSDQDVS